MFSQQAHPRSELKRQVAYICTMSILQISPFSAFVKRMFVCLLRYIFAYSLASYDYVPHLPMAFQNEPRFNAVSPETRGVFVVSIYTVHLVSPLHLKLTQSRLLASYTTARPNTIYIPQTQWQHQVLSLQSSYPSMNDQSRTQYASSTWTGH